MILIEYIQAKIEKGKRYIKAYVYGDYAREARQMSIAGVDSSPVKGTKGLFLKTTNSSEPVFLGNIGLAEAEEGEIQIYSWDGKTKEGFIWIKKDGTIEINGSADNAVRFSPIDSACSKLAQDINAELVKIAAGITTAGGAYTPSPISIDISDAKIDNVKTS